MKLSFELPNSERPEELEIFFDEEGLEYFIQKLQKMRGKPAPIHDHLMTEAWGPGELSDPIEGSGNSKIHKVTYGKRGPQPGSSCTLELVGIMLRGAQMKESLQKLQYPFYIISYLSLFWMLLGVKLKIESKMYSEIILPLKSQLNANPTVSLDLQKFINFREYLLNSVNLSFLVIFALFLVLVIFSSFTMLKKIVASMGIFLIAALFVVIPRITH